MLHRFWFIGCNEMIPFFSAARMSKYSYDPPDCSGTRCIRFTSPDTQVEFTIFSRARERSLVDISPIGFAPKTFSASISLPTMQANRR